MFQRTKIQTPSDRPVGSPPSVVVKKKTITIGRRPDPRSKRFTGEITLRCDTAPSAYRFDSSTASTTSTSSVAILRPLSVKAMFSAARTLFPRLEAQPFGSLYLQRQTAGAGCVRVTDELWDLFALAPSEPGAVYYVRVEGEKVNKPKEEEKQKEKEVFKAKAKHEGGVKLQEEEKDVKPKKEIEEEEPDEAERIKLVEKRRRKRVGRSVAAPSPPPSPLGKRRSSASPANEDEEREEPRVAPLSGPPLQRHSLRITGTGFPELLIQVNPRTSLQRIFEAYAERIGRCFDEMRFAWRGTKLAGQARVQDYEFAEDETIDVMQEAVGGKPVIYLFPPSSLPAAQVTLILSPQWSFSALYPVEKVATDTAGTSTVVWDVSAAPNGDLVNLKNKTSLSYLFWEAPSLPSTPSPPFLTASNGVALPLDLFLPYLEKTLSALSLHTSARNDFITYWLPHFNRIASHGKQVGFRFLPQPAYEEAAKLKVEPKPDVVTRIFLLFKGVEVDEAKGWKKPDEVDWMKEVGVEEEKVKDEGLFRVLEGRDGGRLLRGEGVGRCLLSRGGEERVQKNLKVLRLSTFTAN